MTAVARNKFGELSHLGNESTVEQFFVNRLLGDLGYSDSQIKPKASLDQLSISLGRRRVQYRPDYALMVGNRVRWICEAKGVSEDLDDWVGQCSSYCLELNQRQSDNPVEYFMLTNGVKTRVYKWDSGSYLAEADFHHFVDGNQRYDRIRALLDPEEFQRRDRPTLQPGTRMLTLRKRTVSDLNADFAWAHRLIHRRENLSYTASFMEFVKLIFLKLVSDRRIHDSPHSTDDEGQVVVPATEVRFSRRWIEEHEDDTPNPLDAILFQQLLNDFETEIGVGTKKRIFDSGERLNLSPDTIKALAERFEDVDLISIDADLNGRMFETFLNSTLRGKDLGQYFTPRSVVKLATRLSRLQVTPNHVDKVIDACCGTGGFLIEALAVMWRRIEENASLTNIEREELRAAVATQSLYGVDVARDPALARIARINMYLHGDGGSSIYQVDALDKRIRASPTDSTEVQREKSELRSRILNQSRIEFDVALTNPPFAKEYSRDLEGETQLLDDYELAFSSSGGTRRPLRRVSSMVLFMERYHNLLRSGGRLVTIIDDSLLGSDRHRTLRDWIRERWIVRAVVSLPGDAFQRSQARVKTSILILDKRTSDHQSQPPVFMYYCTAVGVDDAPRQRILPIDLENRKKADAEILHVSSLFADFCDGTGEISEWTVAADSIADRLDVKACLMSAGRKVADWQAADIDVIPLSDLMGPVDPGAVLQDGSKRAIDRDADDDELVTHLRVRYDGFTEAGDEVWTSDSQSRHFTRVQENDIVISHINAVHGAVGVVPDGHSGYVVTNEYTVCTVRPGVSPLLVWALMRAPESRADLLLLATGIGRTRIQWSVACNLQVPAPGSQLADTIVARLVRAAEAENEAKSLRQEAVALLNSELSLDSDQAQSIIAAFKPPR